MDIHDNMSTYKGTSLREVSDTTNRDSMLDGKNLLFMTGFSAGMLFFYLAGDAFSREVGQIYLDTLQQMRRMNPNMEGLFLYILENRMRQALLLIIMATGKLSKLVFYALIALAGLATGVLMLTAAYQLGFFGVLISVAMVFPQIILYFMAFKLIFEAEYYGNTRNYHKSSVIIQDGWHKIGGALWKILKCLGYLFLGVLLETYINTWLMGKILLFL